MKIWTSLRASVSADLTFEKPRMMAATCMTATATAGLRMTTAGWLTRRGLQTAAAGLLRIAPHPGSSQMTSLSYDNSLVDT